ncbi:ferritin-like domain-containing protein [Tahibacter harae]|uniref:Ferritin-like domain-containing protein n=1 Tax=Tahibacter harae TaxID=2963937 RepID=A0ABT1QY25_9GAMM|nr:ferritin-like domain-containing protein [Tahibacter harae]MCQ4167156.1 ferritin-like domain-containing protein [Tahibacter harae]
MLAVAHSNLFAAARDCLAECQPQRKLALTQATAQAYAAGRLTLDDGGAVQPIGEPGRPARPELVPPRQLAQRGLGSPAGRAALVHAVAHIEFNAINLAWDAVYRFRGMPAGFYADWIAVAADEARHFALLSRRLDDFGMAYGDLPAHDGLWDMARRTAHSCLERMALVPRVLEARGLDVTPGMIERLVAVDDTATVAILEQILAEEVAHVAAGTRWFAWCCERAGVDPADTFTDLLQRYGRGVLKGPFNRRDRLAAGFTAHELDRLAGLVA